MTAAAATHAKLPKTMTIIRAGSGVTRVPEGMMTGPFLLQPLLSSQTEGEMTAMRVFAEPGVISHWHSHPRGQILFVLDGVGLAQCEGGEITELRAGDSIWFPANERHWHGAASTSPFSYLSVQPVKNGSAAHWGESVDGDRTSDRGGAAHT